MAPYSGNLPIACRTRYYGYRESLFYKETERGNPQFPLYVLFHFLFSSTPISYQYLNFLFGVERELYVVPK